MDGIFHVECEDNRVAIAALTEYSRLVCSLFSRSLLSLRKFHLRNYMEDFYEIWYWGM